MLQLVTFLALSVTMVLCKIPEESMNVSQIIAFYGYPAQEHVVTTIDGYQLQIQRVSGGHGQQAQTGRPVVFLQHGLMSSSACWVINLPSQSLPYILADQGYDVWLGNVRGNLYGTHNIHFNSTDRSFWDFSWQEMAERDLPAMLDYITKLTGQPQVHYIGHSQGTLIAFDALSTNQDVISKVKTFVALAPVHTVGHIRSGIAKLAPFVKEIKAALNAVGDYSSPQVTWILDYIKPDCDLGPQCMQECENLLFFMLGAEDRSHINETRIPLMLDHFPGGTSVKNVAHFAQMVNSDKMEKYDYGAIKNKHIYGTYTPPRFDLTKIKTPVMLYYSDSDTLADTEDVKRLFELLPNLRAKRLDQYSHCDFVWSLDAPQRLYQSILMDLKTQDYVLSQKL